MRSTRQAQRLGICGAPKSSEKCRMWTGSRQNQSKKSVSKSGKTPMSGPPLVRNLPPVAGHITWSRHLYRQWVKTGKHGSLPHGGRPEQFLDFFHMWIFHPLDLGKMALCLSTQANRRANAEVPNEPGRFGALIALIVSLNECSNLCFHSQQNHTKPVSLPVSLSPHLNSRNFYKLAWLLFHATILFFSMALPTRLAEIRESWSACTTRWQRLWWSLRPCGIRSGAFQKTPCVCVVQNPSCTMVQKPAEFMD